MAHETYRLTFEPSDFPLVEGPVDIVLLSTALAGLPLESRIIDVRPSTAGGISIEWLSLISPEDRELVVSTLARFTQVEPTSESFTRAVAGPVTASTSTLVSVLDFVTPPLEAGRYRVAWLSQLRLTLSASATHARAVAVIEGRTQQHHTSDVLPHAFNGHCLVDRRAGETLRVSLSIAKLGSGPVSAEMSDACFTIEKAN